MTITAFNPTVGLEKVNSADELRVGDEIAITHYNSDGGVATLSTQAVEADQTFNHYFGGRTDVTIHFIKKVARFQVTKGAFGVATLKGDGEKVVGFFDQDGDFAAIDEDGSAYYYGSARLSDFKMVDIRREATKTTDLTPGVDPMPEGYTLFEDRQGDKWTADQSKESAPFQIFKEGNRYEEPRSWDKPDNFMNVYAPFRAIR